MIRLGLQAHLRKLGKSPSVEDQLKVYERRHRLQTRIDAFVEQAETYLPTSANDPTHRPKTYTSRPWDDEDDPPDVTSNHADTDDTPPQTLLESESDATYPEIQLLPLPSSKKITGNSTNALRELAELQLQLEQGQANDALHKVRLAIGHKSFLYRHKLRHAPNYDSRTRSSKDIRAFSSVVTQHADVYMGCRSAMVALGADVTLLNKYQELKRPDLKTDTHILLGHERGTRNSRLSWIWGLADPEDEDSPIWLNEGSSLDAQFAEPTTLTSLHSLSCQLSSGKGKKPSVA